MWNPLDEVVRRQKAGEPHGITSVCSAHPLVIEAAVRQALASGGTVLAEATSNQVDQYGGYTGMRPEDFRELVHGIAVEHGLPLDRVVLGGDHLGPNRWRSLPTQSAMAEADELVAAYVRAGFTKIHLDCGFVCADDAAPPTDSLVAERTARLVRVAETTAGDSADTLRYVIGTEVPVPGGAHETLEGMAATSPQAARVTLEHNRRAFEEHGVAGVWPRVMALVVQPGVEFDHLQVFDYRRERTAELRTVLADEPGMVFEAHSTDYQTVDALAGLVEDHWAVLKVGPGLTFALREALFAPADIEDELVPAGSRSRLSEVVDRRMRDEPSWWEGYYGGDAADQRLARRYSYSYSYRMRCYWPDPEIAAAQDRLFTNLSGLDIPLPLLSAHLPDQYRRVRTGALAATPRDLVVDHVRDALRDYDRACRTHDKEYA